MKHYVKNLWDFSKENSLPSFLSQEEVFTCPCCQRQIRIVVPETNIDWESVAKDWESYAGQMYMACNLLLARAGVDTLLKEQLKNILEQCKRPLLYES